MGALISCYQTALELCILHNIRSIAFPCISTGIFGFSKKVAAPLALDTVRKWLIRAKQTKYSEYIKALEAKQTEQKSSTQDVDDDVAMDTAEKDTELEAEKVQKFLKEEDGDEEKEQLD